MFSSPRRFTSTSSTSKSQQETHYEVLGIDPASSAKDVKAAFLSLSKTWHPDLHHPSDPNSHARFVRIMEAYKVLSRPELRSTYDTHLKAAKYRGYTPSSESDMGWGNKVETNAPRWFDETIWEMRDKSQDKYYADKPYYGIKGISRVHNYWIAGGAVIVMMMGALFHYVALKKTGTFTTSMLDEKDLRLGIEWGRARKKALENGNDLQIAILEAKFAEIENDSQD